MSADPRTVIKTEQPRIRIVPELVPERKPVVDDKVELLKVRRELLTLATRIEKIVNKS